MAHNRRQFLKAGTIAGITALANKAPAQSQSYNSVSGVAETDHLAIAYEQHGPQDGFPVVLLHGFPYDIHSYDKVVPPMASAGFRVIVPYLRGYGPTRFLSNDAPRMAEQAAIAQDFVDLCNVLQLRQVAVAGFDWGNRAACIAAITNPELIRAQVAIGGYSVQDTTVRGRPAPAALEALLWYQWYFNTERGRDALESNRHDIIRYLWDTWSPAWTYSDEDYQRSAPSFDNPDFVELVIHSYRHRHANAPGEDRFLEIERELANRPPVEVPAIVLRALDSGFGTPSKNPAGDQSRFTNLVARRLIDGAGHDLPAHRPDAVVDALMELLAGN